MATTSEVSSREGLSPEQIAFLESNFVVYDPVRRECSQDFSGLGNRQLTLMGETHCSSVMWNIQRKFIEIIVRNQPICMIAETLPPGVTLNTEEKREWRDYLPSSTEVRGGDVREQGESAQFSGTAQYLEWEKLDKRARQWFLDLKEYESTCFRQLATILNDHFTSATSLGIDKDEQMFLLADEVAQVVAELVKSQDEERKSRYKEGHDLLSRMNQLRIGNVRKGEQVLSSNHGLFQEIEKACKQFPQVMAIWGSDHFTADEDFIKALERAKISYIILLPNKQRSSEAMDEIKWNKMEAPEFKLRVGKKIEPLVLKAHEIHRSFLHPELQAICNPRTQQPTVLNIERLNELFLEKDTVEFSAGMEVYFENIPLADFNRIKELTNYEGEMTIEETQEMLGQFRLMLNNFLMIRGLSIRDLVVKGEMKCGAVTTTEYKPAFILSSDKGWSLTVSSAHRVGHASYLFKEMKRLDMQEYSLAPGEVLFFMDISPEEIEQMAESLEKIGSWLDSKLPPNSKLEFEGELFFAPSGVEPFPGAPIQPALVLGSETGLKIKLT